MREARIARLRMVLVAGTIFLPLLVSCTTVAALTKPRATSRVRTEIAELSGLHMVQGDAFGTSVAISDTTVIVGAPSAGQVFVFTKSSIGSWNHTEELSGSDNTTPFGNEFGFSGMFGTSVAISGTTVVVGAPGYANAAGRAFVFANKSGSWQRVAELKRSDSVADDEFGSSVAISGSTIVVGEPLHAGSAGQAYVFARRAGSWLQVAELRGSDTVASDAFGYSVAVSGSTLIVGAPSVGNLAGKAYVFTETTAGWSQVAELEEAHSVSYDGFGFSVAVSGGTLIVGAPGGVVQGLPGSASTPGQAFVFAKSTARWRQVAELKQPGLSADAFGLSVAIASAALIVGAPGNGKTNGRAFLFTEAGGVWRQESQLQGNDTVAADAFGSSVAISGTSVVVGAFRKAHYTGRAYLFGV